MSRFFGLVLASVAGLVAIGVANAQTLTTLASFNGSNGESPYAGVTLSADASTLYGTTYYGGTSSAGTVFSVPVNGGAPTVLASFNGSNGENPSRGLTLLGNTLYGTTDLGGAYGLGEVFSVCASGGSPTVLVSFNGTNGEYPAGGLMLIGSTLYGTTQEGGSHDSGTVFSVPVGGGSPTVLASLTGSGGGEPCCGLTLSGDGSTLYSTAWGGGLYGWGTVFSVPVSGGIPTVLASFSKTSGSGYYPDAGLTLIGTTLYGTTAVGGANGGGTVFSVPTRGGSPTVLASFDESNRGLFGGLTLSTNGGILYGTTFYGGAYGYGTVFCLPVSGGSPTVLASFNGSNGEYPYYGNLTLAGSTLYGTTDLGGAYGDGSVFALTLPPGGPGQVIVSDPVVDINDLTIVLANFGSTGCVWSQGCMDGDSTGTVDVNDLTIVLANFGTTYGASATGLAAAPEPSTLALLLASAACLFAVAWRRRRVK